MQSKKNKKLIAELDYEIKQIDKRINAMFKKERLLNLDNEESKEGDIENFLKECLELKTKRDIFKQKRYFESLADFSDIMQKSIKKRVEEKNKIKKEIEEKAKNILTKHGIILKKIVINFKGK